MCIRDSARDISFYTAEQGGEGYALGGLLYTMGPENKPLVIELPFEMCIRDRA